MLLLWDWNDRVLQTHIEEEEEFFCAAGIFLFSFICNSPSNVPNICKIRGSKGPDVASSVRWRGPVTLMLVLLLSEALLVKKKIHL